MELAHSAESRMPCPNCRRVEEHSILACAEEYRRLVRLKDPEMLEKRRKALAKALGIDGYASGSPGGPVTGAVTPEPPAATGDAPGLPGTLNDGSRSGEDGSDVH